MSCSKWAYTPEKCDGQPCPGDCDHCAKQSLYEMKELFDGIGLKDATGLMDSVVMEKGEKNDTSVKHSRQRQSAGSH